MCMCSPLFMHIVSHAVRMCMEVHSPGLKCQNSVHLSVYLLLLSLSSQDRGSVPVLVFVMPVVTFSFLTFFKLQTQT